ncbi:hypothetical protein D6D28_07479 [Aureobasidium pullulans]|uniref:Uncharacterized protein n=1 Tax=Aureobasidium pullulans TaxID=5580 RepID=A0A4S8SAN4_AURPU|nr:hypothetical protein D6D28_07479 [Aureobasidium pullulans]
MATHIEDVASSHSIFGGSFGQYTLSHEYDTCILADSIEVFPIQDMKSLDDKPTSDQDEKDPLLLTSTNETEVASAQPEKELITFMTLPVELRTIIYKLALITQDKTVTLAIPLTTNLSLCQHTSTVSIHPAVAKPILNVNLLRASPQIYIEASQYAFKNRIFKFSKQCTRCLTHLSLNDSLYLKTLNQHTLSRIEKLEIPISVDCSIEKPARSFRAMKNSKSGMGIVLTTTAAMPSLTSLTVIVHFHNHYCWDVDQFKRLLDQLDLDELFTQVYRQIDSRVEVIWKAEIERSISVQFSEDEDGVAEQATEILRGMAGVFKVLHGMGGNARVGKGKKRRRVRV